MTKPKTNFGQFLDAPATPAAPAAATPTKAAPRKRAATKKSEPTPAPVIESTPAPTPPAYRLQTKKVTLELPLDVVEILEAAKLEGIQRGERVTNVAFTSEAIRELWKARNRRRK